MNNVKRIFVEKLPGFDVEAQDLLLDLKESLHLAGLESLRILNRYDISGLSDEELADTVFTIFSEKTVDKVYYENIETAENEKAFAIEYLPGQYDQRADSAAQCVQIITQGEKPNILSSKVYIVAGAVSDSELQKIKEYCINPVDSREAQLEKPETLDMEVAVPADVEILNGFNSMDRAGLSRFIEENGLAMSLEDLAFCQSYFAKEFRDPTVTYILVRSLQAYHFHDKDRECRDRGCTLHSPSQGSL